MISQTDIKDWIHVGDTRREADNHQGWAVETLSSHKGWVVVGGHYASRELAVGALIGWKKFWPKWEFRVSERVK